MDKYEATARKTEQKLQVDVHSHGQHYTIDEPKEGGGSNTGINPVEMELSALGASLQETAAKLAPAKDFSYDKLTISLEGDLDARGFMGDPNIRNGFQEIRVAMSFQTDESPKKVAAFTAAVKEQAPLLNTLTKGVKVIVDNIVLD